MQLSQLVKVLLSGNQISLPAAIDLAKSFSADLDDNDVKKIAEYLDAVILSSNKYENRNRYVSGFLTALSEHNSCLIIKHLSKKTIEHLIFEKKFINKRSVQIILDFTLRFQVTEPEKCNGILSSFYNRVVDFFPEDAEDVQPSLIFLCNDSNLYNIGDRRRILEKNFKFFDSNQINRIFNKFSHSYNKLWVEDRLKSATEFKPASPRELLNLFILSSVYSPESMEFIRVLMSDLLNKLDSNDPLFLDVHLMSGAKVKKVTGNNLRIKSRRFNQKPRKLRVAFNLSGQMRGYKEAFATWSESLKLSEIEPIFFINTWRSLGRKALTGSHAYRHFPEPLATEFTNVCNEIGNHLKRYPNLNKLFSLGSEINAADILETYNARSLWVDEDALFCNEVTNQERMYYKVQAVNDLAALSADDFDLVVRLRPDKKFFPFGNHFDWMEIYKECWNNIVFSDQEPSIRIHQGLAIGDQLLIANPEMANVLANAWYIVNDLKDKNIQYFPNSFKPHSTFGTLAYSQGLTVKRMPGLVLSDKYLCEAECLPLENIKEALEKDVHNRKDIYDLRLLNAIENSKG